MFKSLGTDSSRHGMAGMSHPVEITQPLNTAYGVPVFAPRVDSSGHQWNPVVELWQLQAMGFLRPTSETGVKPAPSQSTATN